MTELQKVLARIQKELKAPKNQFNSFGKYNYRNAEDILEGVKPLLGEAVLTTSDDIVLIGDRFYVKTTAKISLGDDSICATAFAREAAQKKGMDESQITGSASSYSLKRALGNLLLIDDTKDSDSTNSHGSQSNTPQQQYHQQGYQQGQQGQQSQWQQNEPRW